MGGLSVEYEDAAAEAAILMHLVDLLSSSWQEDNPEVLAHSLHSCSANACLRARCTFLDALCDGHGFNLRTDIIQLFVP